MWLVSWELFRVSADSSRNSDYHKTLPQERYLLVDKSDFSQSKGTMSSMLAYCEAPGNQHSDSIRICSHFSLPFVLLILYSNFSPCRLLAGHKRVPLTIAPKAVQY